MRVPVLVTLSWRWRTLGCLPFLTFAFGLLLIAHAFGESALGLVVRVLSGSAPDGTTPEVTRWLAYPWIAGLALGFVLAWSVHELLRCPTSATLPRLRRVLAVESTVGLALASWALIALVPQRGDVGLARTVMVAVLFAGSGVGLAVANPARFRTWPMALSLCVGLFLPTQAARLLPSTAWEESPALLVIPVGLGLAAIAFAFSAGEHRGLLAAGGTSWHAPADPVQLDMSYRGRTRASRWAPAWTRGRDWARATLHELHGASPLGWPFEVGKCVAALTVILLLIQDDGSLRQRGSMATPWYWLATNATLERPVHQRTILTFWLVIVAMWTASFPSVPRLGIVRPMSRVERARTAWEVTLLRTGWILASTAVMACAFGAFAAWRSAAAGDPPVSTNGAPDVLGALAILGVLAPWVTWARLRFLDVRGPSTRSASSLRQGFVAGFVVVGSLIAGHLLATAWAIAEDVHPVLAPLLFAGLLAGSWLAYRARLDRWFRTAALLV